MAGDGLTGQCHCGDVALRVPRRPDMIAHYNCSLCTAVGWRGIYFRPDEIEMDGRFDRYRRTDIKEPMIDLFRCKRCGMATHWTLLTEPPRERMGINANLFAPDDLSGIDVVKSDGRNWER